MLKVTSVDDMRFSFYNEINRDSIEIAHFAQILTKLLLNIVTFH